MPVRMLVREAALAAVELAQAHPSAAKPIALANQMERIELNRQCKLCHRLDRRAPACALVSPLSMREGQPLE